MALRSILVLSLLDNGIGLFEIARAETVFNEEIPVDRRSTTREEQKDDRR